MYGDCPECKRLSENLSEATKAYFAILEKGQLAKGNRCGLGRGVGDAQAYDSRKKGNRSTGASTAPSNPSEG
jgi:hypothetical protein